MFYKRRSSLETSLFLGSVSKSGSKISPTWLLVSYKVSLINHTKCNTNYSQGGWVTWVALAQKHNVLQRLTLSFARFSQQNEISTAQNVTSPSLQMGTRHSQKVECHDDHRPDCSAASKKSRHRRERERESIASFLTELVLFLFSACGKKVNEQR